MRNPRDDEQHWVSYCFRSRFYHAIVFRDKLDLLTIYPNKPNRNSFEQFLRNKQTYNQQQKVVHQSHEFNKEAEKQQLMESVGLSTSPNQVYAADPKSDLI